MNTWDDFGPFILPYAPGCPDPTMVHQVRQAAIEFIGATFVWVDNLAPMTGDGSQTSFALTMPSDAVALKLNSVAITEPGIETVYASLPTPDDGDQRMRSGDMRRIAFTRDLGTLTVWPAQVAGTVIVPKMALKPSQASAGIPSVLFEQHAQAIANGALAKILAMPETEGVGWTDKATAGIKQAEFAHRKNTLARIAERGQAKSTRRSAVRWF